MKKRTGKCNYLFTKTDYPYYKRKEEKKEPDKWVPFYSSGGNLFLKGSFQTEGYFIRKGTFVDNIRQFKELKDAKIECWRRNKSEGLQGNLDFQDQEEFNEDLP